MLKDLITKLKALFGISTKPKTPNPIVDDIYITFLQTPEQYPNGESKISMYYSGLLMEKYANEWSVSILVRDILAARYDTVFEDKDTMNLVRSTFNIKHSRSIEVPVDSLTTVRFVFNFFTNEESMMKFHEKINPFASNPAAQAFIGKM